MVKRLKGPAHHYPESERQRQDQTSLPDTLMTALSIESFGLCVQNQRINFHLQDPEGASLPPQAEGNCSKPYLRM